jgi:hypothetical protein
LAPAFSIVRSFGSLWVPVVWSVLSLLILPEFTPVLSAGLFISVLPSGLVVMTGESIIGGVAITALSEVVVSVLLELLPQEANVRPAKAAASKRCLFMILAVL